MTEKKENNTVLEVKNLSFTYPGVSEPALYNVNFFLEAETINTIIGPNGSGKSTLLKIILGIYKSTAEINFYNNSKKITAQEAHIGYVPQKRSIDVNIPITVNEFLFLTQKSCKRCVNNNDLEIIDVLHKVTALEYRYKKLSELSGGQLQRVILARALLHNPKILILDEPEAGIDIQGEKFFYEVLEKLVKQEGVTALIATHEMEVVSKYADQVLCLNKTLICAGSANKTLTNETFQKLYGTHTTQYTHKHVNPNHKHTGTHHEHNH